MRVAAAFIAVVACVVLSTGTADAQTPDFQIYCVPTDPGLTELSGMTFVGGTLFAMGDSGSDDRIAALNADCSVKQWIPNPVDPYDVEDLSSESGDLWLSDTGDNDRRRDTVALTRVDTATGAGELHRLTYPDGAHDAETLLISGDGTPIIVTKDPFGQSGIYSPEATVQSLPSPGPVPLQKVGSISVKQTATPGGPPLLEGSRLITGGAVSSDGSVAALRTYTDLYLYHAADGNLLSALTSGPSMQIPLPAQPQGESLAFTADGDLLFGSEQGIDTSAALPPIQVLRNATELAVPVGMPIDPEEGPDWLAIGLAAGGVVVVAAGILWLIRRR